MKVHLYAGDAQESPTTYCGKEPDSVRIHGVYTREAMRVLPRDRCILCYRHWRDQEGGS